MLSIRNYRINFVFIARVAITVALSSLASTSFGQMRLKPAVRGLPTDAILGAERAFTDVGRGNVMNGTALPENGLLVAITRTGELRVRDSSPYTIPWSATPGCSGPRNCLGSHTPAGKSQTEWTQWRLIRPAERFDPAVPPILFRGEDGRARLIVSQTSPERRVLFVNLSDRRPTTASSVFNFSPVLSASPTKVDAILLGGQHGHTVTNVLVALTFADSSFQLFTGTWGNFPTAGRELRILPNTQPQVTSAPLSLMNYGVGGVYGTLAYKKGAEWKTRMFLQQRGSSSSRYELVDLGDSRLSGLNAAEGPQIVWLPGGFIIAACKDAEGLLSFSVGLHTNENLGIPRGSVVNQSPVLSYRIFTNNHDVFIAAIHADRKFRYFRLNIETPRFVMQQLLETNLAATPIPNSLQVLQFNDESFAMYAGDNGVLYFLSAHRAATVALAQGLRQFHFATPEMNQLNPWEMTAWSAFGTALTAVPWNYHALYTTQPPERCHPSGFSPPLTCGKVFFEWNDYGAIPAQAPGAWQTRDWAIRTLEDSNPFNDWNLGILKAYRGSVLLRSALNSTSTIFHELMHELDFDGINGNLVEGLDEMRAEWTRIFTDRNGADLDDAVRAPGYITNYSESNAAEDWAETATFYRWYGATFRHLASLDKALGNNRLVDKYEFTKKIFYNVEYSEFGTRSYGDHFAPIHLMRHNIYNDSMFAALALTKADIIRQNYRLITGSSEGWLSTKSLGSGTIPVKVLKNRHNGDLTVAAKSATISSLSRLGYDETGRIIGYGFTDPGPNRQLMTIFYSSARMESAPAVSTSLRASYSSSGRYDWWVDEVWVLSEPF